LTCQHVLTSALQTGLDADTVVGQPALSSWCSQTFSKSKIFGTGLWAANTGELAPTTFVPGVDAGAIRLNAGRKYRQAIFHVLEDPTGFLEETQGIHDVTLDDIKNGDFDVHMVGQTTFAKRATSHGVISDICDCKVLRSDEKFYFYQDCLQVVNARGLNFSESSDSGAVIVDRSRRVVGIIFAGSPTEIQEAQLGTEGSAFTTPCFHVLPPPAQPPPKPVKVIRKPGSWACKITHVIDKFNADNAGFSLSIPIGVKGQVLTAAGIPPDDGPTLRPEQSAALELARKRLRQTEAGREAFSIFRAHQYEVRRLVNNNKRVATAWHRIGGPSIPFMILAAAEHPQRPVPAELGGYPLKEGLAALKNQLMRYGSSALRQDLESVAPLLESLPGATLDGIVSSLEIKSAQRRTDGGHSG
jgi:hypothetical protein